MNKITEEKAREILLKEIPNADDLNDKLELLSLALQSQTLDYKFISWQLTDYVSSREPIEVIKLLFEYKPKLSAKESELFNIACYEAYNPAISYLWDNLEHKDVNYGITQSIKNANIEALKFFFEKNAPVFTVENFLNAIVASGNHIDLDIIEFFHGHLTEINDLDFELVGHIKASWLFHGPRDEPYAQEIIKDIEKVLLKKDLDSTLSVAQSNNKKPKL